MKRLIVALFVLSVSSAALAEDPAKPAASQPPSLGPRAQTLIKAALPVCAEPVTESRLPMNHALPANMVGNIIRRESKSKSCEGQWFAIVANGEDIFVGTPWFLDGTEGTHEEKLRKFTKEHLKHFSAPIVDGTKTRAGLYRATLYQEIEGGIKLPLEGEIDPDGTAFFFGHFLPMKTDYRVSRLKAFNHFVAQSPYTGAASPAVTVIEFSDFECPSCRRAAGYMKPILEAHGGKVHYIRYDTPLFMVHQWALQAAMAGRAIWRQKPDLFWTYKERVYESQETLTAATIGAFTRGFAQDHELDMTRFDADAASPELRTEMVNGVGTALSNGVQATPTYIVNGTLVDPGADGKALAVYVDGLLKK